MSDAGQLRRSIKERLPLAQSEAEYAELVAQLKALGPEAAAAAGAHAPSNGSATRESDVFRLVTGAELLTLPDPRWLVTGLIPQGFAVLYGPSGHGKSFLALDWSLHVAAELPWYGREVDGGWVVYIAAEGRGGLKLRYEAWLEAHGLGDVERVRFLPEAVNLLDRGQVERARRTLATLPERPRLIVVDTMARTMVGGDENAARDVGMFIAAIDGLRAAETSLTVHHTGRNGDHERGSTALPGAADLSAKLERDGSLLTVACQKMKDAEQWDDLTLRLVPAAKSRVLELVQSGAGGERRQTILTVLREAGEPLSQNQVTRLARLRKEAVGELLKDLDREGLIEGTANGWQVVPESPEPPGTTPSEATATVVPGQRSLELAGTTPSLAAPAEPEPPGETDDSLLAWLDTLEQDRTAEGCVLAELSEGGP